MAERADPPLRSYAVCTTPRSGSTWLCELLKGTGVAGRPEEYFEARPETGRPPHPGDYLAGLPRTGAGIRDDLTPPHAPSYSDLTDVRDYEEHLERTLRLGTTPNGVFAAKLMWRHLGFIEELASPLPAFRGLSGGELLEAVLHSPRFVWMRRRDKVKQAISLWRALQTRQWRLEHPGGDGGAPELLYSFEGLDHLVRFLDSDDHEWERFFETRGVLPLQIVYEDDLEPDPAGTIERILTWIGVDVPAGWAPEARMHRQSDDVNSEWHAAYHRDAEARLSRRSA